MKKIKDDPWVFLSLFYPEKEWPVLLQQAVMPFVEEDINGYLQQYILHFGKDRGDHIGLSCQIKQHHYRLFIEYTKAYFTNFMMQHPAVQREENGGLTTSWFMNFPANSICHSLHNFLPPVPFTNIDYKNLWQLSSACLLNIYGNDVFDREDFFTAALYLNLMLVLSAGNSMQEYHDKSAILLEGAENNEEYAAEFNDNESLFNEIKTDCLNILGGSVTEDLQPVAAWFNLFNNFLYPYKTSGKLYAYLAEEIIKWTRAQLCMIHNGRSFIDFCIYCLAVHEVKTVMAE